MGRNIYRAILVGLAVCALAALSVPAQAQYGRGYRSRVYTKAEVDRVIRRVENQSDRFVNSFDRSLDNSRLDGTRREDNLNGRARDLENDLDALRREFDRAARYQDTRAQVERALRTAEGINGVVRRRRLGGNTERLWAQVRAELNALAYVYNLRGLR